MSFTRDTLRDSLERGGDEQMQVLRAHHEDAYPESRPTPGDVLRGEAERLNQMGLGDSQDFELLATQVERVGGEVRLTHTLRYKPLNIRLLTEPYSNYG